MRVTNKDKSALVTALMIAGVAVAYICQMSPAPLLGAIREAYGLTGDATLNLAVSAMYPTLILGCLTGSRVEARIGLRRLFALILLLLTAGVGGVFLPGGYACLLLSRLVFGLGFGLGVPFFGAAIVRWFPPEKRPYLTTLNGLLPFAGALVSFSLPAFLQTFFGSWRWALGVWAFDAGLILLLWVLTVREKDLPSYEEPPAKQARDDRYSAAPYEGTERGGERAGEKQRYRQLFARREIRLLCVIFMCDFCCYSYVSVVLPTVLYEAGAGALSVSAANLLAALAFPAVGMAGCVLSGAFSIKSGRRKPALVLGQAFKLLGLGIAALGRGSLPICLAGFALFGLGNSLWMPSMYAIPLDLPGMTAPHVGAAYAAITACGFVCGFLSPTLGGWITDAACGAGATHLSGLLLSLTAFGAFNLLSLWCAARMPETGKRGK